MHTLIRVKVMFSKSLVKILSECGASVELVYSLHCTPYTVNV